MNIRSKWLLCGLMSAVFALGTSCSDDDVPAPSTVSEGKYSLGTSTDGVSYILSADDLSSGSVSPVGNGVEFGAAEFITSGNYIYFFSRSDKKFYQYELNADGSVTEKGALLLTQYITDRAYSQNLVDDNTILIIDPLVWGEPEVKWLTISLPDFVVSASGTATLPTVEKEPGVNWAVNVGNGRLHGNKFVMGSVLYDFDGNYADGSHAVVFDFPGMTNPSMISTDKMNGELGIFANNGEISTESGDLYFAARSGDIWGKPVKDGVHGALLRIKNGETDFDEDYLLDFTDQIGESANIRQIDYIGNGIAIAMLFDDTKVNGWGDLENDHYYFARVDLEAGTATKLNVPLSDASWARKPMVENGHYFTYLKSTTNNTTHVIDVDVSAGTYTQGVKVEGDNVQGYSITKHPEVIE